MKKDKLIPKRRFKEFENDEAWEQRKLGEFGYFYYGKSAPKWSVTEDAKTPCVRYGELYTKHSEKIDRIYSYTNIPRENLKFSTGNEVLVPRVGEDPLDFANCAWLSIPDVAIGEMISVYNTEQNPLFTSYMFNSKLKYEFAKRVEGGNVSNLYYAYLEDILISFPSLAEQEKIASFFDKISSLITLHQRKLKKLKDLKLSYLSEMFPKEGEKYPRRRFEGFTEPWEQRKLGDNATIKGRLGWKSLKKEEYTTEGPCMIAGRHIKDGIIDWNEVDHIPKWRYEESPEIMLENGDVIFSKDGTLGNPAIIEDLQCLATINSTMMLVRTDDTINPKYFYQVLKSNQFQRLVYMKVSGSSIPHLFQADMKEFKYWAPQIKEQQKIGMFLHQLDSLITLHQQKLEKLENIKKAYLNEMFI